MQGDVNEEGGNLTATPAGDRTSPAVRDTFNPFGPGIRLRFERVPNGIQMTSNSFRRGNEQQQQQHQHQQQQQHQGYGVESEGSQPQVGGGGPQDFMRLFFSLLQNVRPQGQQQQHGEGEGEGVQGEAEGGEQRQRTNQFHFGEMGNGGIVVSEWGVPGVGRGGGGVGAGPNDFMGWISQAMGTSFGNIFQEAGGGGGGNGLNAGDFVFVRVEDFYVDY